MFYGRVDVYWPDGLIESYQLNKPTIAVGRSTGNDIVLETTAISRYHITFTFNDQQVLLEDLQSVNGTYVDGVRLPPNDPILLRGGEEIQIGDIRLIFHPPTDALSSASDATQRITFSQPTYRVELEGPDIGVAPGAYVQARLKIENIGDETDRYFVEIDGLPKGWARVDRVEMEIESGEYSLATINFKPLRRSETRPGEYPFVVRVRSKSKPAQTVDAPTTLRILPFSGFGMALGTLRVENGNGFKLYLHNQGSAPLPLRLHGSDRAQALVFQFPKVHLVLGPGERQTVLGTIRPRRRLFFGPDREREFALNARAQDASGFVASVPGVYVESGMLPQWAPVLAIPVVAFMALLVVGAILLLVGNDGNESSTASTPATAIVQATPSPVMPTIAAFSATAHELTLGEEVVLTWDVTGADKLSLMVNHTRQTLDVNQQTYKLTPPQTGTYTLTLEAWYGDQPPVTRQIVIEVQAPPTVTPARTPVEPSISFRATKREIAVGESVELTWEVTGAERLEIQVEYGGTTNVFEQNLGENSRSLLLNKTGIHHISLWAWNEDVSSSSLVVVRVYPAVTLELQVLDAAEQAQDEAALVRNVLGQTVRVSWQVTGAVEDDDGPRIWLTTSSSSDGQPEPLRVTSGHWDIEVTPGRDQTIWQATLDAEGQDGITAPSVTEKLTIVDPTCYLTSDRAVVYAGPSTAYARLTPEVILQSPLSEPLIPLARDPSGDWLQARFAVAGNEKLGWVQGKNFHCTNFEIDQLVETEDYPPPPTPTPPSPTRTPAAVPTSTPTRVTPPVTPAG